MNSIRIYRIILFIPFYLFFTDLSFSQIPLTVGDYRTIASGDFENPLVWETWDGTAWNAATAKPNISNNVFIQQNHEVRLTDTEFVNHLYLFSAASPGRKLNLQTFELRVNGSLRAFQTTAGIFFNNSVSNASTDWIYPETGSIVFVGNSRIVVDRASWSANTTNSRFQVKFRANPGQTLIVNSGFKANAFHVESGTVLQTLNTAGIPACSTFSFNTQNIPAFNGTNAYGELIIEPGAILVSECPGPPAEQIIRRSATIPAGLFHLKPNANFILLGNNPEMDVAEFRLEGSVFYSSEVGSQNMIRSTLPTSAIPDTYHNLLFTNNAAKTLRNDIFLTGNIERVSGPVPTDGPTYLRFVGTANQLVTNWEMDLSQIEIDKPTNTVILDNDLRIKENLFMKNGQVNFNGFDLYLNTSGTGEYLYEGGEWLNLHNLSYNNIPSTFTPSNATFPFEDTYQGGVRRMRLTGNTPGGNLNIRLIEIPGANWDPMYDDNDGTPIMYQLNSYFELSGISSSSDPIVMELAAENLIVDNVDDLRIVSNGVAAPGLHLPGVDADTLWARRDLIFSDLNNTTFTIGSYRVLSILPVEWLETKAIFENEKINIYWTLAKEVDNIAFQIEGSINGVDHFELIHELASQGDTESPRTYSYEYAEKRSWNNIYYRIKQIDSDGKGTYSKIFRLEGSWKELEIPKLYPNPLGSEQLHLIVPSSYNQKDTFIQIIGTNGLIRFSDTLQVFKDSFDSSNLSPGIYFLLIHEGEKQHRIKFIKR
ncbi:T9SS type A sorting domain-containing protein [Belliella sp. R4-6]|uniref:T9SS type A sorting domain-containing protein n=1 Tax=Belliella alkalica TaxID=1730871 RepID=A0ABS9VGB8_9BACT|nr:T9SS type A sorting domain-containing protein [Belliella alkalica]MCH7415482.1 T9SS type A sorting domain-containing protein [Belliella alkalica]